MCPLPKGWIEKGQGSFTYSSFILSLLLFRLRVVPAQSPAASSALTSSEVGAVPPEQLLPAPAEPRARSQGSAPALTAHQTPPHACFSSCLVHYTIAKMYEYFLCLIFVLFQKILYLFDRKRLAVFDQNLWMPEPRSFLSATALCLRHSREKSRHLTLRRCIYSVSFLFHQKNLLKFSLHQPFFTNLNHYFFS